MSTTPPAAPPVTPPPAPSPATTPPPAAAAPNEFDKKWDELDSRSNPKKPDAPAAVPDKEPKAPDPKAAEPKPGEPKPKDAPAPKDPKQPEAPKALREQLEKRNKDYSELEAKHRELERKIADAESKGKDTTALAERIAAVEKERDDLRGKLSVAHFQKSPDFIAKHEKPFNQAADYAKNVVEGLTITEEDAEGNATTRPAKWEDFAALYQMPKNRSIPLIQKLFKEAGPVVTQELLSLQKMDLQRQSALQEEEKQWKENHDKQIAESSKQREFIEGQWRKVNADIAGKSEWFQPNPQDAEETKLLNDGYALVDAKPQTIEQQLVHDAHIRNRAAAYGRMRYVVTKQKDRIAELEATIAEMKGSEPGDVKRPGGHTPPNNEPEDWKAELRKSGAITGD